MYINADVENVKKIKIKTSKEEEEVVFLMRIVSLLYRITVQNTSGQREPNAF